MIVMIFEVLIVFAVVFFLPLGTYGLCHLVFRRTFRRWVVPAIQIFMVVQLVLSILMGISVSETDRGPSVFDAVAILLMVNVCLTSPALSIAIAKSSRAKADNTGLCPECRYDLRGDLDIGCPECGWNREP